MEEIEKDMKNMFCKTMSNEKEPLLDIITILYLEPNEISMEDMAKKTGYSLASISNTMKMLESNNFIQRIKKPKTKKVYFFMEKDIAKINLQKIDMLLMHIKDVLKELPIIMSKYSKNKDKKTKERLSIIQNYYNQLLNFNDVVDKWKIDLEKMSKKWQKQ